MNGDEAIAISYVTERLSLEKKRQWKRTLLTSEISFDREQSDAVLENDQDEMHAESGFNSACERVERSPLRSP